MECFRCERDGKEARLLDAIYENDVVKICERCAVVESIPIIRKPTTSQLKEAEKSFTVNQRLKKLAGLEKPEERHETILDQIRKLDEAPELETAEKNPFNLIDNFHWHVQRARRNRGLSQKQLAWALGESETAIKMLEKAELPEEPEKLIRKLEQFFQIRVKERTEEELEEERKREREKEKFKIPKVEKTEETVERELEPTEEPIMPIISEPEVDELEIITTEERPEIIEEQEKSPAKVLSFKPEAMGNLTVSDLKKMKEEQEKEERLAELEERSKKEVQADNIVREIEDEEKRKQDLRERVAGEMRDIALGKEKPETIYEKKKVLEKAVKKLDKEEKEEKEKIPTISELMEKKKEELAGMGKSGEQEGKEEKPEKEGVPSISDLVEKKDAEKMVGDEIEIVE